MNERITSQGSIVGLQVNGHRGEITKNPSQPLSRTSVPLRFYLHETEDPKVMVSGVLFDEQDKHIRRQMVGERYLGVGYIDPQDPYLSTDLDFSDNWEDIAIPLGAKRNGKLLSSVRFIPNLQGRELPINQKKPDGRREFPVFPQYVDLVENAPFEISQLAKHSRVISDHSPSYAIMRATIVFLKENRFDYAVGLIDKDVYRYLNGSLHFDIPTIGDLVWHLGSYTRPALINPDNIIKSAKKSYWRLGRFLEGADVSRFKNWYERI